MNTFDNKIFFISKKINKNELNLINPTNYFKEKKKFFKEYSNHTQYNPNYSYSQKISWSKEKKELEEIEKKIKNSVFEKILKKRVSSFKKEINLLKSINTKKFCQNSKKVFGKPTKKEINYALELLTTKYKSTKKNVTPLQLVPKISKKISHTGFRVNLKKNMSAKASVNLALKKMNINQRTMFNKNDANRLITHEIETHIYRYLNGLNQPFKILSTNFGENYLKTEEGLAVFNELQLNPNSFQKKIIAGRLYAVNFALKKDFFDTFEELTKYFNNENSFIIAQRVKRGIPVNEKGAFTKDYCYLSGLMKIEELLIEKKIDLKELYYGKISFDEIKLVKKLKNIQEPIYLPKHYSKKISARGRARTVERTKRPDNTH